jgi:hypothetical protein
MMLTIAILSGSSGFAALSAPIAWKLWSARRARSEPQVQLIYVRADR